METETIKPPSLLNLGGSEVKPMSDELSELFLNLYMMEKELDISFTTVSKLKESGEPYPEKLTEILKPEGVDHLTKDALVSIMVNRLSLAGEIEITLACTILLRSLMSTPGDSVLWAWTLKNIHDKHQRKIDLNILSIEFPVGFPLQEGRKRIWDAQKGYNQDPKVDFDNLLDLKETWDS